MNARLIERIETNVERAASAAFAGAVGFAVFGGFGDRPLQPELGLGIGVAAVIAYLLCRGALATLAKGERRYIVPIFDVRDIEPDELMLTSAERVGVSELALTDVDRLQPGELMLTDADRLQPGELVLTDADRVPDQLEPLVLDNILAELGPDARVVRLFDPKAMPTPGQLRSRIDSHVEQRAPQSAPADAAQALSDALAQLRRSLR